MTDGAAAVVCDELSVVRGGVTVLPGLSAQVASGRITGLLGPSGSGKTTLIRSIVGVQQVAGGTVTVLGLPAGTPELRSRVAYVTQDASVYCRPHRCAERQLLRPDSRRARQTTSIA